RGGGAAEGDGGGMLSVVWFLLVGITVAAAIVDVASYRIPNMLVLAVAALFVVVALINFNTVDWLSHIAAGIVMLGAGVFLYGIRQMGAGDAKLLAALALWSAITGLVPLLFFVSVCGLIGMLAIVLLRIFVPRFQPSLVEKGSLPRVLKKGQGIPYGIGIAPGAIIASFYFPPYLWRF